MRKPTVIILLIALVFIGNVLQIQSEEKAGDDSKVVEIRTLIDRAKTLTKTGEIDTAIALCNSALEQAKKELGEHDSTVAYAYRTLGLCYYYRGDYKQTEIFFKSALEIHRANFGADHPQVAMGLDDLGSIYVQQGRYDEAEALMNQALGIKERAFGPDHFEVAKTLSNCAWIYMKKGKYADAGRLLERELGIMEKKFGADHPSMASTLNNLGVIYRSLGRYDEAESVIKRALEIKRKESGDDNLGIVSNLINLGNLYMDLGRYAEAESLYRQAVRINERALGPDNIESASSSINLGFALRQQGKYDKAESRLKKAQKIIENTVGADHPLAAMCYGTLGKVYREQNRCAEAETLLIKAATIEGNLYHRSHPDVTGSLNDIARLYASMHRYNESLAYYRKAQESRRDFINYSFSYASESQKLEYVRKYPIIDNSLLSLALIDNTPESREAALEMLFDGKGIVLEAVSREKETAFCSFDSVAIEKYAELNSVGGRIATMVLEGPGKSDPGEYRDSLKVLTKRKNGLEAELSQACSEFAEALAFRKMGLKDIAAALPEGCALWEIIRYRPYNFDMIGSDEQRTGSSRYIVFQLTGESDIEIIDLGDAELIDSLIAAFQNNMSGAGRRIAGGEEEAALGELTEITQRLYSIVFAPAEKYLKGKTRIIISPDGELNLLPYYTLPCPDGGYVIEKYEISYVSSGRDLLKYTNGRAATDGYAIIIADPDFDVSPDRKSEMTELKQQPTVHPHLYIPTRNMADKSGCLTSPYTRIPSTRKEGKAIADLLSSNKMMKVGFYNDHMATEDIIKGLTSPPIILHLATHGFFCPEAGYSESFNIYENPLIYSGLILAGANRVILDNADKAANMGSGEDGILTSLEVTGLNLLGTDLVVLSACRTGVGEVKNGEGVYGLRRSFQYAGAQSIVMSLWDIPDKETVMLMQKFYQEWLSGESKSKALRNSALKMLKGRRGSGNGFHPLFWGGFVLVGNPD
jgi:CHAT domain-containing protein/tetratricopeptide (TPR) repeat protein